MNRKQRLISGLLLAALPIVVAWFHLPVTGALLLLILALGFLQVMKLTALVSKPDGPELELETILQSHFAEKSRWCLDRLGVEYAETRVGGVIGAFFTGRSVPMLTVRTGRTRSSICESSHILRYLYGRYGGLMGEQAAFLEPTEKRLEWEQRIDRYGVDQQVWIYHHLLGDPALCKEAWGSKSQQLPLWQRWTILLMYPFFAMLINRGFQPDRAHYEKAVERTEALLADTEKLLADGRMALLGGEASDFVDLTLASLSALWLQPKEFASRSLGADRLDHERFPAKMQADMKRWRETYPATTAHMERLYREERISPGS